MEASTAEPTTLASDSLASDSLAESDETNVDSSGSIETYLGQETQHDSSDQPKTTGFYQIQTQVFSPESCSCTCSCKVRECR